MFILTTIADVIQIEPFDFKKPSVQALEDNINEKYANKIIQKVGLCICFFDLLYASEGLIGYGEGTVNVKTEFRLVIFRPFKGEIISGTISDITPLGCSVHVEFFEDILSPFPVYLHEPSSYAIVDGKPVFIWRNKDEESGEVSELYYERNERVRFRVEEELWNDQAADEEEGGDLGLVALSIAGGQGQGDKDKDKAGKKPAWSLLVSMGQPPLGPVVWWEAPPEE